MTYWHPAPNSSRATLKDGTVTHGLNPFKGTRKEFETLYDILLCYFFAHVMTRGSPHLSDKQREEIVAFIVKSKKLSYFRFEY